ncbi:hypothetical protein ACWNYQ_00250 [Candidatus Vidania fulgoroideorum]
MYIISLESTFDDTCFCIYNFKKNKTFEIKITHKYKKYLGIIPKYATNNHIKNFKKIFSIILNYFNFNDVKFISYSSKPGLSGSINISKKYCKSLSEILKVKVIKINHLKAHIFSNFIGKVIFYPFISFLISGGNTIFYLVKNIKEIKKIGGTIDNSVGEVLNKLGRKIKRIYPVHNYIEKNYKKKYLIKNIIKYPKTKKNYISLSGIYTKYFFYYKKNIYSTKEIILNFFKNIILIIKKKIIYFYKKYRINNFFMCGGFSKNTYFRKLKINFIKIKFCSKKFCEDNATMISHLTFLKKWHILQK